MKRFLLAAALALGVHGLFFAWAPRLSGQRPIDRPKPLTVTFGSRPAAAPNPGQEIEHPTRRDPQVAAEPEPAVKPGRQKEALPAEETSKPPNRMAPPRTETPTSLRRGKSEAKPLKRDSASPSKAESSTEAEKTTPSSSVVIEPQPEERTLSGSAPESAGILQGATATLTSQDRQGASIEFSAGLPGPSGEAASTAEGEPVSASPAEDVVRAVPAYQHNPPPEYPKMARRRGYEGTVVLEALVTREGKVKELRVLRSSGYPVLDRSAEESVREWVFEPGSVGGRKVDMWVRVPVRFELRIGDG